MKPSELTDDELLAQRVLVRNGWDVEFSHADLFKHFKFTWETLLNTILKERPNDEETPVNVLDVW